MEHKFDPEVCAKHLSGMVQFPTVSNFYEEKVDYSVFEGLHKYLEETYPLVHKHLKKEKIGKAGLLYTWKGNGTSGELPIMFMAHQDVVPEGDHAEWKYPPFSGEIAEGQVWGRGSGDCKSNICAQLEAIEYLLSVGFEPEYDIYLAYGYNEEVAGGNGGSSAVMTAELLKSRGVRLGGIMDEGGGISVGTSMGIDGNVCKIGLGEKGYADYEIVRTDPGGHSSKPAKDGALVYVAKAILAVEGNQFPYRVIDTIQNGYKVQAPYMKKQDPKLGELFEDVEKNLEELIPYIDKDPMMAARFHTTLAITMAHGSAQSNILPERASVTVNSRLLAGDTLESVQKHIESVIPEGMTVTLQKGSNPSPISRTDGKLYHLISELVEEKYPGTVIYQDYMLGGTDARFMYDICDYVYRFSGFYNKKEGSKAHQVNETMDMEALASAPEFYVSLLTRYGKD